MSVSRLTRETGKNFLCLKKGIAHYMFVYDDAGRQECLVTLGRFASDKNLPDFTWYDCAVLSAKIRESAK